MLREELRKRQRATCLEAEKRKTARVRKGGTASGINSDYASLENFRTGKSKAITLKSIRPFHFSEHSF